MEKYAIIKIGSAQYRVQEGENLTVQRQNGKVVADVLLYSDGADVVLGTPTVKDARVELKVLENKRGEKLTVSRFKSKSRYRKSRGYRDEITVLRVEKIEFGAKKPEPAPDVETPKKAEKVEPTPQVKKRAAKQEKPKNEAKREVKKVKKGSK